MTRRRREDAKTRRGDDEKTRRREDEKTRIQEDEKTRRRQDEKTRRRENDKTRRREDEKTRRREDEKRRRQEDAKTRRREEEKTRRRAPAPLPASAPNVQLFEWSVVFSSCRPSYVLDWAPLPPHWHFGTPFPHSADGFSGSRQFHGYLGHFFGGRRMRPQAFRMYHF